MCSDLAPRRAVLRRLRLGHTSGTYPHPQVKVQYPLQSQLSKGVLWSSLTICDPDGTSICRVWRRRAAVSPCSQDRPRREGVGIPGKVWKFLPFHLAAFPPHPDLLQLSAEWVSSLPSQAKISRPLQFPFVLISELQGRG